MHLRHHSIESWRQPLMLLNRSLLLFETLLLSESLSHSHFRECTKKIFLPISLKLNLKKQLISMIDELKSSVNNANAFLEDVFYKKNNLFRNMQVLYNQKTRYL